MVERPGRVEGKVCVVTGGRRADGSGAAEALAAEGAIVVVADLDGAAAEAVAASIQNAEGAAVDVTDDASVTAHSRVIAATPPFAAP